MTYHEYEPRIVWTQLNILSVKRYSAARGTPVLEHVPYSPDLALYDFFPFSKDQVCLHRNPVRVEGRSAVKISGASKCFYKRRLPALL